MPEQVLRLVVAGALLVHGLGHGGALGALVWIWRIPSTDTGGWHAARSWALPRMGSRAASLVASTFWVVAMLGFVGAALTFSGVLLPAAVWGPLAVASAIVSILGIVLFFGTWPAFNTLAALAMNAAVLIALLWVGWPPAEVVASP